MGQLAHEVNLLWLFVVSFPAIVNAEQNSNSYTVPVICMILAIIMVFVAMTALYYMRWDSNPYLFTASQHNPYLQGTNVVRGLNLAEVESLPSLLFSKIKICRFGGQVELECTVCLDEFDDQDILRVLPRCFHIFHLHCVEPWLASNFTCPVCRARVVLDWRGSNAGVFTAVLERVLNTSIPKDTDEDDLSIEQHVVEIKEGSSIEQLGHEIA